MHKPRLTSLADGIFAIVMTLLAFEIKIPQIGPIMSDKILWGEIVKLSPLFLSYVLSFSVLATYWMAHHFTISIFAKNIDRKLVYLNVPFLMAVTLIPFSSHLLGNYYQHQIAVVVYSVNIIIIGLLLLILFHYVIKAKNVKNPAHITARDIQFTRIRILLPPFCALLAIAVSYLNPIASLYFLVFAVVFNLIPGSVHMIYDLIHEGGR